MSMLFVVVGALTLAQVCDLCPIVLSNLPVHLHSNVQKSFRRFDVFSCWLSYLFSFDVKIYHLDQLRKWSLLFRC